MFNMFNAQTKLCHGLVAGQGQLTGLTIDHAWLEVNDELVIDLTIRPIRNQVMSKHAYYAIGRIKQADVIRYDVNAAIQQALSTGTYGPWDDKLLNHKSK